MTNGEFVSGILNDAKALNKDTYIPRRHILEKARSVVETYVAQRLDSFDLTFQYDVVTTVACFELESVDYIKCGMVELKNCPSVMKSKKCLPKTINGRISSGVLRITSMDGNYEFRLISPNRYSAKKNNKYVRDLEKFAIIKDGHLILPNSEVETVTLELLTFDRSEAEDCDCNSDKKNCKTLWDEDFVCPSNIFVMVRDKTMGDIASTYLQIRKDENPNLDENIRSQTVA